VGVVVQVTSKLRARLRQHRRMQDAIVPRNPIEEGGMYGEKQAINKLRKIMADKDWFFFAQPLLPDPNRAIGRYEIDIIGLAPNGIVLIEVKYWKGIIKLVKGRIKQGKRAPSDIFGLQQRRIDSFQRLFRTVHQRPCPEVRSVLLLTHPKGEVSKELLDRSDVRTLNDLDRLPELLQDVPAMEKSDRDDVARMLGVFGTWDKAIHRGPSGGGLNRWGIIPEEAKGPSLGEIDLFDRSRVANASFHLRTTWWRALFKPPALKVSANLRDGDTIELELDPESRIPWIQPGQGKIERGIPLYSLKKIVFGRESREDPRRYIVESITDITDTLTSRKEKMSFRNATPVGGSKSSEPEISDDNKQSAQISSQSSTQSSAQSSAQSTTQTSVQSKENSSLEVSESHREQGSESKSEEQKEAQTKQIEKGERWREIKVGQTYQGTIDGWHETHGMFVELLPGVNALLPMRSMPPIGYENLKNVYREGSGVSVVVKQAKGKRRILLSFSEEED
jgi:hypothetical protein